MAGFEVATHGRFWVATEGISRSGCYCDFGFAAFSQGRKRKLRIGIHVCVGNQSIPAVGKVKDCALGKERRAGVALIFRGASAQTSIALALKAKNENVGTI